MTDDPPVPPLQPSPEEGSEVKRRYGGNPDQVHADDDWRRQPTQDETNARKGR